MLHLIAGQFPQLYRGRYMLPVAAVVGLLLGLVCQFLSPLAALLGLAVVYLTYASLKRPELALLMMVTVTSTIVFVDSLPVVPIGVGSFQITDVMLLGLLALVVVRALAEPGFKLVHTPLDGLLVVFYAVAVIATAVALSHGSVTQESALREVRTFTYYLALKIG